MNVSALVPLLRERIGLEPDSLGAGIIAQAVAGRMRALKLSDVPDYVTNLNELPDEWDALLDDLVVSETWFFRGGDLFAVLAEHVRQAMRQRANKAPFRILSASCSTGEEPYSMAMALVSANVARGDWTIDAVDLSRRNVNRAYQGRYSELSFRETDPAMRRKHFHQVGSTWELDPNLRDCVRFHRGNLLDPQLFLNEPPFDLIFCRNVLIYLHAQARERVLILLDRLLAAHGLLCGGHAEPLNLIAQCFRGIGETRHFLFERTETKSKSTLQPRKIGVTEKESSLSHKPRVSPPMRPRILPPPVPVNLLEQARKEADAGNLSGALRTCQAYLASEQASAEAYCLLGAIHHARKEREEAVAAFRKALYLDPQHEEALTYLMLLSEESGQDEAATRLRQRLRRQTSEGKP